MPSRAGMKKATRLFRLINNGTGPVYVYQCIFCERAVDWRIAPLALSEWITVPYDCCPECWRAGRDLEKDSEYTGSARSRYRKLLEAMKGR